MSDDPTANEEHPRDPSTALTFLQFLGVMLLFPLIYAGAAALVELARRRGIPFSEDAYGFSVLGLFFAAVAVVALGSHWLGRMTGRKGDEAKPEAPEPGDPGIFQYGMHWIQENLTNRPWVGGILVVLAVIIPKFFRDRATKPVDPDAYFMDALIVGASAFGFPLALFIAISFLAGLVIRAKRAAWRGGPS